MADRYALIVADQVFEFCSLLMHLHNIMSNSGADSHDDFKKCRSCDGKGVKISRFSTLSAKVRSLPIVLKDYCVYVPRRMFGYGMYQQVQTNCDVCHGTGKVIKKKCHVCQGKKVRFGLAVLFALD